MTPAEAKTIAVRLGQVRSLLIVAESASLDRNVAAALAIAVEELGRIELDVGDLVDSHAEAIAACVAVGDDHAPA